jgi:hypothetical protein
MPLSLKIFVANAIRRTLRWIDEIDPSLRLSKLPTSIPDAQLLSTYRYDNWQVLLPLVDECRQRGWPVYLHALDRPHPALASETVTTGAGHRFENLNRFSEQADPTRWTVISDDDVRFPYRSLASLVGLCRDIGMDIAQPAHRADSYYSYRFTRRRPGVLARTTSYVEQGPVVVFSPPAWSCVTPFPEAGMGWGVELDWHDLRELGLTLGIVDSVPVVHLGAPARSYDLSEELARFQELLHQRGLNDMRSVVKTDHTYCFWNASTIARLARAKSGE